jgi:signal transduction histidine kinase
VRVPLARDMSPVIAALGIAAMSLWCIAPAIGETPTTEEAVHFGTKNVLFLSGDRADMPAMREVEQALREAFHASSDPKIELFPEYLDFARFPVDQHHENAVRYLQARYGSRKIDLIVAATGFGLEFILSHRQELFPGVPIVFCATDERNVLRAQLPSDVTGIAGHFDIERTVRLIFALQPNVPEIICVGGTSAFDRELEEDARKVLENLGPKTRVRWMTNKSLEKTKAELARARRSSAVFYISMLTDATGRSMTATDAARDLCRVSKAPIYGFTKHFLEAGTVGGALFDFAMNGQKAADLSLKVLRGHWVPIGSSELEMKNPLVISWTALKKWHLPESNVPAEAIITNKTPTLWETHRILILATAFIVALQTALISGFIVERLWRQRAEEEARKRREEVTRLSRISLLGEMTASIAHEVNQPLSGISSNVNAARRFIDRGQVDPVQLREILVDIGADARRASSVIQHIRNSIKKGAALRERIDLNDIARHVAHTLEADARLRSCELILSLANDLPPIKGDPLEIEQVLINLVNNAFDAMRQTPPERRKVDIVTEKNGDGTVQVSVRDYGPGISGDARSRLFEQFYTTKEEGLGMGLAIVRSIIESHGGKISTENIDSGGAQFCFVLPVRQK